MDTQPAARTTMVRVDPEAHQQLVELAKSEGRKVTFLASQAIRELVERRKAALTAPTQ